MSTTKLFFPMNNFAKDFASDPTDGLKSSFIVYKEVFTFRIEWLLLPACVLLGRDDS